MSYGYSARLIELNKQADPKLLGVRLGKACIKKNLSVHEVANKFGVSRQTVYNWFMGRSSPQNVVAEAVNDLLAQLN